MAEKSAKKKSYVLSILTRNSNILMALMDESAPLALVNPLCEKTLQNCEGLEKAQEDFVEATDIDVEEHQDGLKYLIEPDSRRQSVLVRYAMYVNRRDEADKEEKCKEEEEEKKKKKEEAREEELREKTKSIINLLKEEFFPMLELSKEWQRS